MRSVVRDRLIADPTLALLIPSARWLDGSAVDELPPPRPFAVLRWGAIEPGVSPRVSRGLLDIWVHDELGSYARIDTIQRRIRVVLTRAVDAGDLIMAEWQGGSGDQIDPGYNTANRVSTFRVVGTNL